MDIKSTVDLTLGKRLTRGLPSLERANGMYSRSDAGFKPSPFIFKAYVQANQNYRVNFVQMATSVTANSVRKFRKEMQQMSD